MFFFSSSLFEDVDHFSHAFKVSRVQPFLERFSPNFGMVPLAFFFFSVPEDQAKL